MCGIAGLALTSGAIPDGSVLDRLSAALAHRGPDGEGRHAVPGMALAHRRLAIIDLETGDQPLFGEGGTALVANAEIYNYLELRESFGVKHFATRSDCEPALRAYNTAGTGFGQGLRGMYAIALADSGANPGGGRLVLSRDPFGIKPLYYAEMPDGFAFASEPQALIDAGLADARLDPGPRDELFQLQFTLGRDTIYDGIKRVLPGETLTVEKGRIAYRLRQPALPPDPPRRWREEEALGHLDAALMGSVEIHQRADVPYGMFLSGGVDSSALLACMRELNDRPVEAFTAGFSGTGAADERVHAKRVATAAGARFHDVEVSEADFWAELPAIAAALDDPTADYAVVPTYKLGRLARNHGLKVVLSGEGGDELFAGYGRYRRLLRPRWMGGRPMRGRGILSGLGVLRRETGEWREHLARVAAERAAPDRTRLQAAQSTDCADWLPNDLLIKLDRCLMAHGVEGRTPLLDRRVADIAMRLPDRLKVRRGVGKYLLRRWLDRKLPEAGAFEPKRGFTVPVAEWIAGHGATLGPLVARQPGVAEVADPGAVAALFAGLGQNPARRAGHAAWVLLFYALWHRRHMEGLAPDGGVFDCLG